MFPRSPIHTILSVRKIRPSLIAFLSLFFLFSCATTSSHKKYPQSSTEDYPPVERESMKPESSTYAMAAMPRRQASLEIVEQGRQYLDSNRLELATKTFEEAVTVDPTNGVAFFYLAKCHYLLKEPDVALGILDKAEGLLAGNEDWLKLTDDLRTLVWRQKNP